MIGSPLVSEPNDFYKRCSTCKSPIGFGAPHYTCSVSTCNRPKLAMFFCSLPCWEAHVPEARHRDAWAEPQKAPSRAEIVEAQPDPQTPVVRSRVVSPPSTASSASSTEVDADDDVLIVVSKLKKYIRTRSEMNTSDTVMGPLSNHLRQLCNEAIRNAAREGRKTVLDRDFAPLIGRKQS